MDDLTAAQAAYDAANAVLAEAHGRLCAATGDYAARQLGPGWRVVGLVEGALAERHRRPGRGPIRPVTISWRHGDGDRAWSAWAVHEGRDSDRCGTPDPETGAYAPTARGAMLTLAAIADGMATRARLPGRVADLRHLAQYCRDVAAEMPEGA